MNTKTLKIWNGIFNHKSIHKYTWEQYTKALKKYYLLHNYKTRFKTENAGC